MNNRNLIFLLCLINLILITSCEKENIIPENDEPEKIETLSWNRIEKDYQMPERFGNFYHLHLDNEDNIWISTHYIKNGWTAGLWKYDNEQWSYENAFENYFTGDRNKAISGEIVFIESDMWFGLNNNLVKFDGINFEEYSYPQTIDGDNELRVLHLQDENEIWVVAGNYIATFKNNQWSEKFELPAVGWKYDLVIENDTIWLSTYGGLFKHYNGTTIQYTEIVASLGNGELDTIETYQPFEIEKDDNSRLFVSSRDGLLIKDNGVWSVLNEKNSIMKETRVIGLAVDKNNLLWVGTDDGFYTLDVNNTLTKISVPIENYCRPCETDEVSEIDVDSKNRKIIISHDIILTVED